ncbi:hypothetical protein OG349_31545 [Streptomyces sp. NBC_01317]|uniref:hypothetical protein n=1 Tax=Streptomyces sp. NBC_01317 TaxID=2903822 RepID=UPI002E138F9D|nr:hypothetical protein OG349_31545 [Streptomyces sp. NBC_01317]
MPSYPPVGRLVVRREPFDRLRGPAQVTVVSAPSGSGKSVLPRSWSEQAAPAGRVAWSAVAGEERDGQGFRLSVVDASRRTGPGSELVQAVSAAPDLDGWALVERLLNDLAPLDERVRLVVDDVHQLDDTEAVHRADGQTRTHLASARDSEGPRRTLRLGSSAVGRRTGRALLAAHQPDLAEPYLGSRTVDDAEGYPRDRMLFAAV